MNPNPQNNTRSWKVPATLLVGSLSFFLTQGLFAQEAAPAPAAPAATEAAADEEFQELDPFEVTSEKGSDYRVTNSTSVGRINSKVIELPQSVSIISEELIKDTNIQSLNEAFKYTAGVATNPDDALRNDNIRVRGFPSGFVLRNGFKKYYSVNLDAADRIEVLKGPSAAYYGLSQPGGVISYVTKRPLSEPVTEIRLEYGSNERQKAVIDNTGPLKKDVLAYRVVASYEDSESWKDYVTVERYFAYAALQWKVNDKITVDLNYEYDDMYRTGGVNTALVGNEDYFRDYYVNDGYSYGYRRDWMTQDNTIPNGVRYNFEDRSTTSPINYTSKEIRYPYAPGDTINPNAKGPAYNPRWSGYTGTTSNPVKTSHIPDYQMGGAARTGIPVPNQASKLDLMNDGKIFYGRPAGYTNDQYEAWIANEVRNKTFMGWRTLKLVDSGALDEYYQQGGPNYGKYDASSYQPSYTENIYPRGYNWNPNGAGAVHDTGSHSAGAEVVMRPTKELSIRYTANYVENWYYQFQQYNSDPDMDGFTLNYRQGLPQNTRNSITSGANLVDSNNRYYSNFADVSYTFDVGRTTHTIVGTGEYKTDDFFQYKHVPNPATYGLAVSGTPPTSTPGVGVVDLYVDDLPDYKSWDGGRVSSPTASLKYDNRNQKVTRAAAGQYRGQFFDKTLGVSGALRYDEVTDNNYLKTNEVFQVDGISTVTGVNYRLPGSLKDFYVYGNYSTSFEEPGSGGFASEYTYWDDTIGATNEATRPLDPVEGLGYELGVKTEFKDSLINGSVAVFHLERDGIPISDTALWTEISQDLSANGIDPDSIANNKRPRKNGGTDVIEGGELDLFINPTTNWTVVLSTSYYWKAERENVDIVDQYGDKNQAPGSETGPVMHPSLMTWDPVLVRRVYNTNTASYEIQNGAWRPKTSYELDRDNQLPVGDPNRPVYLQRLSDEMVGVPDLMFKIWTKYDFSEVLTPGLEAGVGMNYQSESLPDGRIGTFGFMNEAYVMFDALVAYEFSHLFGWSKNSLRLALNVKNIFDERVNAGGNFGISAPREWVLTAAYRF